MSDFECMRARTCALHMFFTGSTIQPHSLVFMKRVLSYNRCPCAAVGCTDCAVWSLVATVVV